MFCCNFVSYSGGDLELVAQSNTTIVNLRGVDNSKYTLATHFPLHANNKITAVIAKIILLIWRVREVALIQSIIIAALVLELDTDPLAQLASHLNEILRNIYSLAPIISSP